MKNKTIFEEPEDLNDFEDDVPIKTKDELENKDFTEDNSEKEKPKQKKAKEEKSKQEKSKRVKPVKDTIKEKEEKSEEADLLHQDTKRFDIDKEIVQETEMKDFIEEAAKDTKSDVVKELEEARQAKESWHEMKKEEAKERKQQTEQKKKKTAKEEFDFVEEKRKNKKHPVLFGFLKLILRLIVYVVLVCGITYLVLHYVAQRTVVDGSSMESTLHDKDNLIIDKLTYRYKSPKRFDIIVFPYQTGKSVYYIKRIIGLPGETVRIDTQGNIYINEKELQESYGMEVMKDPGLALNGITLGKDEYFVLGDNRNDSTDSRSEKVGIVKGKDIIGKAVLRVYPFDKISLVNKKE